MNKLLNRLKMVGTMLVGYMITIFFIVAYIGASITLLTNGDMYAWLSTTVLFSVTIPLLIACIQYLYRLKKNDEIEACKVIRFIKKFGPAFQELENSYQ